MGLLFTLTAALAGGARVALSLWLRARSAQSRQWPCVEGTVLESRVDDTHLEFMKPVLRYRYAVDGRSDLGFRATFSGHGVSRQAMTHLIHPYAVGQTVRVHYDPATRPWRCWSTAAVRTGCTGFSFGVGFCALAVYLALCHT